MRKRMSGLLSKRGSASKSKGSSFERKICKELSMWLSNGDRDDLFWRSAMSGGRATVKFRKGGKNQTQAGDISAIDSYGERLTSVFMVECKAYKDLDFIGLFHTERSSGLHRFWREAQDAAELAGRHPLLIAKQNLFNAVVVVDGKGSDLLFDAQVDPIAIYPHLNAYVYWYSSLINDGGFP